jgi:putative DNA primase/helicase
MTTLNPTFGPVARTPKSAGTSYAQAIAAALGGQKSGSAWMACCPAHNDKNPSLSIRAVDGNRVLVHCFAGCPQDAVVAALRQRGLWRNPRRPRGGAGPTRTPHVPSDLLDSEASNCVELALQVWRAAQGIGGTPVEQYLRSRGLRVPPTDRLRFHGGLWHPSGHAWPAMVALVTRGIDDEPIGIHRTFLALDGKSKAPVAPQKMMLGPCGGGAVRLTPVANELMVGEGIETCLAVSQEMGRATWAALSTSGMKTLKLPADVLNVTLLADGDEPGEHAAVSTARRWKREGRRVRIARPPSGTDFNDLLLKIASDSKEQSS